MLKDAVWRHQRAPSTTIVPEQQVLLHNFRRSEGRDSILCRTPTPARRRPPRRPTAPPITQDSPIATIMDTAAHEERLQRLEQQSLEALEQHSLALSKIQSLEAALAQVRATSSDPTTPPNVEEARSVPTVSVSRSVSIVDHQDSAGLAARSSDGGYPRGMPISRNTTRALTGFVGPENADSFLNLDLLTNEEVDFMVAPRGTSKKSIAQLMLCCNKVKLCPPWKGLYDS